MTNRPKGQKTTIVVQFGVISLQIEWKIVINSQYKLHTQGNKPFSQTFVQLSDFAMVEPDRRCNCTTSVGTTVREAFLPGYRSHEPKRNENDAIGVAGGGI